MQPINKGIPLERLLLTTTLVPAMLVIVLSGWIDYLFASRMAQETQDAMLLRTAYALASRLMPDEDDESTKDLARHFNDEPQRLLQTREDEEIDFLVIENDGDILVGAPELKNVVNLQASSMANPLFSNDDLNGKSLRTVQFDHTIGTLKHHIVVSETRKKKTIATNQIFWNTLWPNLLLLLVICLVLLHGTRQAVRPLQAVCESIDQRDASDLSPIPKESTPQEIETLITAMNRLLDRLAAAKQEQQIFLSGAAHQLRTPLAGIQTQLELAIEECTGSPRERMVRVMHAIQGLAHCSQQMLALARSSWHAQEQASFVDFDLSDLAKDSGSAWLDTAIKKRIELVFELLPTLVHGSPWMLQEMLGNLLDNAIKYSPENTEIRVRCQPLATGQARLEVMDAGPGISEEEKSRVLDPFYRGAHPAISGSGLGLTIAHEIVKRHDGTIHFSQNANHQGTSITVVLPCSKMSPS